MLISKFILFVNETLNKNNLYQSEYYGIKYSTASTSFFLICNMHRATTKAIQYKRINPFYSFRDAPKSNQKLITSHQTGIIHHRNGYTYRKCNGWQSSVRTYPTHIKCIQYIRCRHVKLYENNESNETVCTGTYRNCSKCIVTLAARPHAKCICHAYSNAYGSDFTPIQCNAIL